MTAPYFWTGLAALALAAACDTNFPPSSRLDRARVLAIRAEPPEVAAHGSSALDALVYLAADDPPPSYSWSWCPLLDPATYDCSIDEASLAALIDPDGSKGVHFNYDLGTDPQARVAHPAAPELLRMLCRPPTSTVAGAVTETSTTGITVCREALSATLLLTVTVGDRRLRAFRSLDFMLEAPPVGHENPVLESLELIARSSTSADGSFPREGATSLVAGVHTSSIALNLAWYAERGTLEKSTTEARTASTASGLESLIYNWWYPPPEGAGGELIFVLRDLRGGVAWLRKRIDP